MKPKKLYPTILLIVAAQNAIAFDLDFDFSYDTNGFFSDSTVFGSTTLGAARTSLIGSAASFFESIITDDLTAIDSDGINQFNAGFFNPGTGSYDTINGFDVAANTLTVFVGGRSLGGSTLGVGGPGGFGVSGTTAFVNNAVSRGETGETQGPSATEFAPWGGSISFNSDASWYYDPDVSDSSLPGINSGESDFYSVALHELGHVLGIGTADSWDNQISNGEFTGANVTAANGGTSPDVTGSGGHFANGTQGTVDGDTQEVAMDPNITTGTQKKFTDIDIAALQDIGFSVSAN